MLYVLSFENDHNDPKRNYFDIYYMLLAEIKGFNAATGNKPVFD